jgi:hypothetical protein
MTLNNQLITKRYYRKVFKVKKQNQRSSTDTSTQNGNLIFGNLAPEYESQMDDLNCTLISLKRKSTPVSDSNLRRSKRGMASKDGYKHSTPIATKSKGKGKRVSISPLGKHHHSTFTPVDFPDLAAIDKMINLGVSYPEIPIGQLQKVASERCGIHPMEVTRELLLAAEEEGNNQTQALVHGSQ